MSGPDRPGLTIQELSTTYVELESLQRRIRGQEVAQSTSTVVRDAAVLSSVLVSQRANGTECV